MSDPVLKVLIVEDSETDTKLLLRELRQGGRMLQHQRVQTGEAMRAALAGDSWDLVISDWNMPSFSALAALKVLRESGLDLPFIVVSGTIGEEQAVEAMRAGAQDYVMKDRLTRLLPAVEREVRERTARRAAESTLRAQEARFQALIEKSADGIAVGDRDGRLLYASPAYARIFGVPLDEQLGRQTVDMVHPDDRRRYLEEWAAIVARPPGETLELSFRLVRPDGGVRWVEATATNLLEDPAVGGIVTNFRDVSDRKEAGEALRASETRFARLSEAGLLGIAVANHDGNVVEANHAYLKMFGFERTDLGTPAMRWTDRTPADWREVDARATKDLRSTGIALPWEKEILAKDGRRVPVLIGIALLDGQTISFLIDLTEKKRVEAALEKSEEQLRQSQKLEAIGRLAGGVAHDFNNLLSVILSYAGMLSEDLKPGDPMRVDLQEILAAGRRAADLTRQLLAFSRQQVLEPRIVDLNSTVAGMEKMLRRLIGEDVQLTTNPGTDLGRVRVDPGQIEQVIMNLAVNSRDAMPQGGTLTLTTAGGAIEEAHPRLGLKPGPYVTLTVSDTGSGMDAATQARIFEPFFTTKEKGKGTGLGLSTVFGIVQQSGGAVEVASEPGRGASFTVWLPRVEGEETPEIVPRALESLRGRETILLVEDEEAVRGIARAILTRHGYTVVEAANGGEALLVCEEQGRTIDLLVTDVVLPRMSGRELAERLAVLRPTLRVLFMSGYTDDEVLRHGVGRSSFAFLQKPIVPETLVRKVRQVLDAPGFGPSR